MATSSEERDLIERAKAGDAAAFEQLVGEYQGTVRRMARALCRDWAEADDLAQDALVKAYVSIRSYRFQAAFSTWLFRIVRNAFIDRRRSAAYRHRPRESLETALASEGADPAESPDEVLAQSELAELLWRALESLRPEFARAVVLFDVEGFSQEELAAIEEVPVGTIKSRLSRARAQLRVLLQSTELGASLAGNEAPPGTVREEGCTA
ncbi:MAG: sigma-70 family RNA polymerase sigma factor [Myxococcales bacterium]|nr:sigma-70 family RNA polymerase sigma factor [Myxococcales bacterium]